MTRYGEFMQNGKEEWLTSSEIAKRLKIHYGSVSHITNGDGIEVRKNGGYHKWLYPLNQIKNAMANHSPNAFNHNILEASQTRLYDDYWKLNWDEFIVAADAHTPFINEKMFNRMLKVAQHYGIKNFIHGGDFWDQSGFSYFETDKEDMTDFSYDVKYSKGVAKVLTDTFKDVRFFLGSHDVRFYRMLMSQNKANNILDIWQLLDNPKIKVSKYRYCDIGKDWRINHPKNIVKVGGLPAIRMTAKHHRNIVFAHGHWLGYVYAPDGQNVLIAPGCLVDKKRVAYVNAWDTSHDIWVNGFLMVVEKKKFILFSEFSPWEIYLN